MFKYADRISNYAKTAAVVRDLFMKTSDAETISFGIGAPANESLPVEITREIVNDVFTRDSRGVEALQYSNPIGLPDLRREIAKNLLQPKGLTATEDDIAIIAGGLEAMNIVCQLLINPGDVILVESPTFVQSVEIFELFQAKCVGIEMDDEGVVIKDLEKKIKEYNPKFIYVIPSFQNPSGRTMRVERRKAVAELASKYEVPVLEDDPYKELRFVGEDIPPIKYFDKTGHVIYANSLSKIYSPGARLGFIYASRDFLYEVFNVKTATNSQNNGIAQVICAEFFKRGLYQSHLAEVRKIYLERRNVMLECIDSMLPAGTKRVCPEGGLFTWVELPEGYDTTELLKKADDYKVSFLPGEGFFVGGKGEGKNCMRMGYGNVTVENIREGMKRLASLINDEGPSCK